MNFSLKYLLNISVILSLLQATSTFAQRTDFSIATDMGVQRSLKKEQRFWAAGHTIQALFHYTPKDGAYCWISYYSLGKFNNRLSATAKSPSTTPQQINYLNTAQMRFKQISLGLRHYLKGTYNSEDYFNLYGYAGFGLLFGRVENVHSVLIDTSSYNVPVRTGGGSFKRLTLDLGIGWEVNLGGAIYFYSEGKAWVPTTDYPSSLLFVNRKAPLVVSLGAGVRVLFD